MKKSFSLGLLVATCMIAGMSISSCDKNNDDNPPVIVTPAGPVSYTGTTVVWPVANPDAKYESQGGKYTIDYNETDKTAVITLSGVKFAPTMPALVMNFPGINWTTATDHIKLLKDELIPEIGAQPFLQYKITNLVGTEKSGESLDLTFICDFNGHPMNVEFSGTSEK